MFLEERASQKSEAHPFSRFFIATEHDINNKQPDGRSSCVLFLFSFRNSTPYGCIHIDGFLFVCVNAPRYKQETVLCVTVASQIAYIICSLCLAYCAHVSQVVVAAGKIIDRPMFTVLTRYTHISFQFGSRFDF